MFYSRARGQFVPVWPLKDLGNNSKSSVGAEGTTWITNGQDGQVEARWLAESLLYLHGSL